MRKVFKDCYAMDQRCYDEYGLTEDILMEHAAKGIKKYIEQHYPDARSILIVAGPGNNGADGITLARQLQYNIRDVKLHIPFGVRSAMAQKQLERTSKFDYIEIVEELCEADIVVDALFGAGLNRPLEQAAEAVIDAMNDLGGIKIACDIPSGIDAEGRVASLAFDADVTITMGARKESLYADGVKDLVGEIVRVDLGIRYSQYTKDMPVSSYLLDRDDLELPHRDFMQDTHKGTFGHAAIFCGEKPGAGIIAGMAAARFGAGLTTLVVRGNDAPIPPWLMYAGEVPSGASALALGMGMGHYFEADFLQREVVKSRRPILLDADVLGHTLVTEILKQHERTVVLTPHPKEFARLWQVCFGETIGVDEVQANRFELVRDFARAYPHATLLLKGANMLITHEEKVYINPYGTNRLSKGGSGDVLSGLIVALLAQGYSGVDAAIHGSLALTEAAQNFTGSDYAMLPTDLIDQLVLLGKPEA